MIPAQHQISLSDPARHVLARAVGLARDAGSTIAGTDHLLLALSLEHPSIASRLIDELGVDLERIREEAIARVGDGAPRSAERELVNVILEAQTADRPPVVDPFADELPDLVDGLLEPDRKVLAALGTRYSVSRRIVRGDRLLYARLVRMAQDWVSRYPLAQGVGNFGSIDGFEAAGMDFTEGRLSPLAPDANLFPLLLANGGPGIPPHNLTDVITATIAYIEDPAISANQLLRHLKGPDFPTGGVVINGSDLAAICETGNGTIVLRGRTHSEPGASGEQLVITEIPYGITTSGTGGLIEQIADRVSDRTLQGIADLGYDSRHGLRIVVELRSSTDVDATVEALHEQTDLQIIYPVRLVARVEGQPHALTLKRLIGEWVAARLLHETKDTLRQRLLAVAERHHDPRRTTIG